MVDTIIAPQRCLHSNPQICEYARIYGKLADRIKTANEFTLRRESFMDYACEASVITKDLRSERWSQKREN